MTLEEFKKWAEKNDWIFVGQWEWSKEEIDTFWITPSGLTPTIQFRNNKLGGINEKVGY